jgi:thiamine kinase-like enzyme
MGAVQTFIEELVATVWPGREAVLTPLGGGITNRNFHVGVGDESFVLRIGGRDTQLLGIDRRAEAGAARMAAEIGVGPEVVAFLEAEGCLVTRFIEGSPIPVEQMRTAETIREVAAALVAIHGGSPVPGTFDAHRVIEAYRDTAEAHGVRLPDDFRWAKGWSDRIEQTRGTQPPLPCHNDLLNGNFIHDGRQVRIVDWEYAGMGDRLFDLANFSINHEFQPEHDEVLLAAYFGRVTVGRFAALRLMRFMSDFREAMWGVVQQGISDLDFDFVAYANEHFERLRATAADPRFKGWLNEAHAD